MYQLHTLGWRDFQHLCHTITREIVGQTVESFLDSYDGGRDGAFCGHWKQQNQEDFDGKFVIQCKHTSRQNYSLTLSDIAEELEKVERLVNDNRCDTYVLMSNAGISGTRAAEIQSALENVGVKHIAVFGSTWINQQIRENSRLRMLVPRLYGLGDLSQILDERAYQQARVVLETMREDLGKVVLTNSYQKAVNAINEHGFVLLIGEPASGKTTIASLLAMASVDQWGSSLLKLDDPAKVVEHWNTDEPSQFFWLDDVFGVTQYEKYLANGWNHVLPQIKAMISRGVKIVMTSRDYIYNSARHDLKTSVFPILNESQVVIDVHDLSDEEKRQILYNHLKLGKQPSEFLTSIKPYLNDVATNTRFIPETARRISDPIFTKDLNLETRGLAEFVNKQEQLLGEVLHGIDNDSRAALALIYLRRNRLDSPVQLTDNENVYIERLKSSVGFCLAALHALDGSLVSYLQNVDEPHWTFKHPTIGDAFAKLLVDYPEYLEIYIQGADTETLTRQVTCGDMLVERAIILPESLWIAMADKLNQLSSSNAYKTPFLSVWSAERAIHMFLANRCSDKFLSLYLESDKTLLDKISDPSMSLRSSTKVNVAKRLHDLELLPENHRKQFIKTVSYYAIEGMDTYALKDSKIKSLFTETEFKELVNNVSENLVPRLADVRRDVELAWSSSDADTDSAEHMHQFDDIIDPLFEIFESDSAIIEIIEQEKEYSRQWIDEHYAEPEEPPTRTLDSNVEIPANKSTRSIFDDIDAV